MPYRATAAGERLGQLSDILQRLEASLGPCSGAPVPLEGGITNRNFRVTLGGSDYVVRQHGPATELLGIDRASEQLAATTAAELGIGPRVAAVLPDAMACEYVEGEPFDASGVRAEIDVLARALRAFHDSGVQLPSEFRVRALLEDYERVARGRGSLPPEFRELHALAARIEEALAGAPPRPCHNDLLPGNLIRARDGRVAIVDWEYAGMGDARFDLGNLSVNNELGEDGDERLLRAYHGRPPTDGERAQLKLARILSDVRESAWGALQSAISELDFDFEGYGREHHERLQAAAADPLFEEWLVVAR